MQSGMFKDKIEDLITRLARAVQVNRIYGKNHDLTREAIGSLYQILGDLLSQKEDITLGIIGDEIAYEKEPLYDLSVRRKGFIDYLKSVGIKKISLLRGVSRQELEWFNDILSAKTETDGHPRDIEQIILEKGIRHITVGDISAKQPKAPPLPVSNDRLQELAKHNYMHSIQSLTKTFQELKENRPLSVDSAKQIVEGLIKNMLQNKNMLLILTSLKAQDENTFMHGVNVSIFTLLQAEVLGLEEKYMTDMGIAAMLHDVGKLSRTVDEQESISFWTQTEEKPAPPEQKEIRQDVMGAKILLETDDIGILPAIAAFEHNINYDLSGVQRKLYGKKLNLVSMMISISDYYDQMRRKPSYYKEGGPEKAYEEMMRLSGTKFHPDLLKNFFSVLGIYPPGTLVELDTKEIALVIQSSMLDIRRPQVEILYNSSGEKYKDPKIVNLVEKDKRGQYKRSIVKSISPLDHFQIPEKYS